jgi:pilus assembly protein CpaE
MSLIIVTGVDPDFEERVREAAAGQPFDTVQSWETPADANASLDELIAQRPEVVVLGPELSENDAFAIAHRLDRTNPEISVLVIIEPGPGVWQQAMAAGVRGIVSPDADQAELSSQIDQALETARRQTGGGRADEPKRSRVITVISPKGGAGKTVMATNLAVGLAAVSPRDVALVDLDLQFGDITYALLLEPSHTMLDAVSALQDLDPTTLKVFLTGHGGGMYTLCAPDEPAAGEEISADDTTAIIDMLASEFRYVIIDTGAGLGEHTLAALERSTDVVLISDMDVPSVKNLRKAVDALDQLGMVGPERHFVLNRADSKVGLSRDDVATAAGMTIDLELPSSRHVPIALNEGQPLIMKNPRNTVARRIAEFAARFAGLTEREYARRTRR